MRRFLLHILGVLFVFTAAASAVKAQEIVSDAEFGYIPFPGAARVFVRSNMVRLKENEKAVFELQTDNSATVPPGTLLYFPHTLTNISDRSLSFKLEVVNQINDQLDLTETAVIIDKNKNRAKDLDELPLLPDETVTLAPTESLGLLVAGRFPIAAKKDQKSVITLSARETGLGSTAVRFNNVTGLIVEGSALFVEKIASRPEVEVGETIDYVVRVRNVTDYALTDAQLVDDLPVGFTYERGSLRFERTPAPDPSALTTKRIVVPLPTLGVGATVILRYRARVGISALQGDGINRAIANAAGFTSNVATAKVNIRPGVFTTKGVIIGRVFVDNDADGQLGENDLLVPGVRIYLEDGTYAITDIDGKYSFYGLNPYTHVLKVDRTSLPRDAKLTIISNHQAGDTSTRFVPLKNSELHQANFALAPISRAAENEIKLRQTRLAGTSVEIARELQGRLTPDGTPLPIADPKSLASSGIVVPQSDNVPGLETGVSAPTGNLLTPSIPVATTATIPESVSQNSSPVPKADVEAVLDQLDNTLGFGGVTDGQRLSVAQTDVLVKGPAGVRFTLAVNGAVIGDDRVGTKATIAARSLEAWHYVGVNLRAGENRLRATMFDLFGNERGNVTITVIAPGDLAKISLSPLAEKSIADGVTPAQITVELSDALGTPIAARTPVTLAASIGQWVLEDLNPTLPGVQTFIEGGKQVVELLPPLEPGNAILSAASGTLTADGQIIFTPNLRPMLAVGVIEGAIHFNSARNGNILAAGPRDAFEAELRAISAESNNGRLGAGARAAFFLKGKIKGDALLTAAFDSDKDTKDRLFRDIQPGEYYPVYGDSSVRGYDAQSTSKLYVRIDKNRSYLLFGDFTTQPLYAGLDEPRVLGNYQRSLTGLKEHYETDKIRANLWASQDSTRQVITEIPANGTSGPYVFAASDGLANSERIEILTRDRNQPSLILETRPMTRFFDYEFEPFTGRLLFRAPIPSVDSNLNPNTIRITYEVDQGGDKFFVYGADAQVKVTEKLEVGAAYARDEKPENQAELASANASYLFAQRTKVAVEMAASRTELDGVGYAGRVDFKHQDTRNDIHVYLGKTEVEFQNPSASLLPGRVEGGFKSVHKITDKTSILTQGLVTEDVATGGQLMGARVDVERAFGTTRVAVGVRHSRESSAPAAPNLRASSIGDVDSVRARVTFEVPKLSGATAYVEYEQDVNDSEKQLAAFGLDYSFKQRGRLYARHEFISSLGGPFELNSTETNRSTIVGFEAPFMKGGQTFNEYRASNEILGREAEAALGVRNLWEITKGVRASTSFERIVPIVGAARNESTAVTGAIEYARNPLWRANGRLELRNSESSDSVLNTLGYARQLSRDWTLLAKSIVLLTQLKGANGGDTVQSRLQTGFAWRPAKSDRWSALGKYEYKYESDDRPIAALSKRHAHIVAGDVHYLSNTAWTLSTHYAGKWVNEDSATGASRYYAHLASSRFGYALNRRWDVGLNAALLTDGNFEQLQYALGPDIGFTFRKNFTVGLGYNLIGFREEDLAADHSTEHGVYLRLRIKFDETSLPSFGGEKETSP
ncbi:hypothetical protein [Oleiharenicola lentus]|uniref:hypothetical protein n=1 Tax=Oleiharenicola lentus TaxID=2508720 RepID=UPI003F67221F